MILVGSACGMRVRWRTGRATARANQLQVVAGALTPVRCVPPEWVTLTTKAAA
jgi:hypothetical protein